MVRRLCLDSLEETRKNIFREERGPSPPNFCNDSTEKGAGAVSPPNIWSCDCQQSLIGARRRTPANAGILNRRKTRKRITTHNNRQSINSSTGRLSHKARRARRTAHAARAGVCRHSPAQKIAKSPIGFLAGPNWGGGNPWPPF